MLYEGGAIMRQAATRVEDREYELFQETAANIGTTTADVLRMFIYAFNDHHGFPYPVQSMRMQVEGLLRSLLWRRSNEARRKNRQFDREGHGGCFGTAQGYT